ncbi:hypothetical protein ACFSFY_13160 [Sporosarcina siberiensis]|uniref:Uncharacterized protein n=1 Tax=Sporosarcina siberiensis TaxID=1365606 RepID=A0ABW4SHL6_9BACL
MNQIVSEEPEISTYNVKLIEKLPPSGGIPSGIFVSTSRANSNAVTLGYGNAHKFKTTMVKNQKDTTIAHYNMYEVKSSKKPFQKGDILLHHTSTKTFYVTHHNIFAADGYRPIPL